METRGLSLRQRLLSCTADAVQLSSSVAAEGSTTKLQTRTPEELASLHKRALQIVDQLSGCLADAKRMTAPQSGSVAFKVHNIPAWPEARFAAWLKRQKISVQVCCRTYSYVPHTPQFVPNMAGLTPCFAWVLNRDMNVHDCSKADTSAALSCHRTSRP
jgi:hypothetical protein